MIVYRCRGRYFELIRSTATTQDFQRIKLQELTDEIIGGEAASEAARMPRNFEVHLDSNFESFYEFENYNLLFILIMQL